MANTIDLHNGFRLHVDSSTEKEWEHIPEMFDDAFLNQTWSYAAEREKTVSTVVLRKNGDICGAGVVRIKVIPVIGRGIAYIGAGPMWRLKSRPEDLSVLAALLDGIRREYAVRRQLLLRISPNIYDNAHSAAAITRIFLSSGYKRAKCADRTLFLDLSSSMEELRAGMHRKWRNVLGKAEKSGLLVSCGTGGDLFGEFRKLYSGMVGRKRYSTDVDIDVYARVQDHLPDSLKPLILICASNGVPVSAVVLSTIGDTGVYLLGAGSEEGMRCGAANLLQWKAVEFLKDKGFKCYDLGGCSPERNPDTFHFKAGICGKSPAVISRIGIFEVCDSLQSLILVRSVEFARRLKSFR